MKKLGLLLAGAVALSVTGMMSISASAASVVDFENGDYSFVSMKTDDGGDASELSVADFDGSKQLKVDVKDCANVPKVRFDLDKLIPGDSFGRIRSIEMSVTLESKDGSTPPGWAGGALGTQGAEDGAPAWAQTAWEDGEYDNARSKPFTVQRKFLLARERFANDTEGNHMILMRWGCDVDYNMYVDNVRFLDGSGNEIELLTGGDGAAVITTTQTEAEVTETEAAETAPEVTETEPEKVEETAVSEPAGEEDPVKDEDKSEDREDIAEDKEDAPDSDDDTTAATTGNPASILAASAVVLSGYAVAMTRRKKKVSALLMKIN